MNPLHLIGRRGIQLVNTLNAPLPQLGRMMVFVDGENLVARFQAMLDAGHRPSHEVRHRRDVYAWSPGTVWPGLNVVRRATFYTYVVGVSTPFPGRFLSFVKTFGYIVLPRRDHSDDCRHPFATRIKTIWTSCISSSGDGDYEPLLAECQRQGSKSLSQRCLAASILS